MILHTRREYELSLDLANMSVGTPLLLISLNLVKLFSLTQTFLLLFEVCNTLSATSPIGYDSAKESEVLCNFFIAFTNTGDMFSGFQMVG